MCNVIADLVEIVRAVAIRIDDALNQGKRTVIDQIKAIVHPQRHPVLPIAVIRKNLIEKMKTNSKWSRMLNFNFNYILGNGYFRLYFFRTTVNVIKFLLVKTLFYNIYIF